MKRVFILSLLILITGCGKSQINCEKKQEENYVTINQNIIVNFNHKKVSNATYKIEATLKDKYKESSEHFTSLFKEQFSTFEKDYNIKLNVDKKSNGVIITMNINKENFNKLYLKDETKEDVIKYFEKEGYSCNK